MGLTLSTAIEIFSQPDDLTFLLVQKDDKWGLAITRGPGHDFKPLLDGAPVFDDKEAVLEAMGELLEAICSTSDIELNDPSSPVALVLNPEGQPVDDAKVLTAERREWIIRELEANRVAKTYEKVLTT